MQKLTSKEAQDRFAVLLEKIQKEPVVISRHGREVAVVMSREEYERLEAIEEQYWIAKAQEGERSGYIGVEESEAFLKRMMNAEA